MQNYKEFFKGKKVTVVGLGLLGKRLLDIAFLYECGAGVTVTDLKDAEALRPSLKKLEKYKGIKYSLGRHKFEDFENKDFILKGQGVPLDSPYIKHAKKNKIPIEMDESLFMKLAPGVKMIGVTGTRGKSTTTMLIYEILKEFQRKDKSSIGEVYLGGNIKGTAALPLLKKVKTGDVVVFELSSWQLQGFGEDKISPHISVFTNFMPDHLNYYKGNLEAYYKDKSYIYKFQRKDDVLVLGESMKRFQIKSPGRQVVAKAKNVPKSWKVKLPGAHNLENIACAIEVAKILGVPESIIKKSIEDFTGAPGRLEFVREVRGVKIYNDTNSTTPTATLAGLTSFPSKVVLIMGGMDKGLEVGDLNKALARKTKRVFLLPGSGSDKIENKKSDIVRVASLKEAALEAFKVSKKGDVLLFSPGFASFNMFKNEYDRGEQFMKLVNKLK